MSDAAIILTHELLHTPFAKTAHGLVRGPSRWPIVAVVDSRHAGRDAGEVLDGRPRGVPVVATVAEAVARVPAPNKAIIGVATPGGTLPDGLRRELRDTGAAGLTIYNGLHTLLAGDPEVASAAERGGGRIVDFRRPRPTSDLKFWCGSIRKVKAPRIAILGTDCAVGKRTTGLKLREACRVIGISCEMIYTGQTGWLQGLEHGFVLDATPNDFVSGELENAVVSCAAATNADLILIEGQSSLRNPSGPCGSEMIVSAEARGVILQHALDRECFEDLEHIPCPLPSLAEEVALVRAYGAEIIGITLNGRGLLPDDIRARAAAIEDEIGVPTCLPVEDGVDSLAGHVRAWMERR